MTGVGVVKCSPVPFADQGDNDPREWMAADARDSRTAPTRDTYHAFYRGNFNEYVAENWLPQTSEPWNRSIANDPWSSHDATWKQYDVPRQEQQPRPAVYVDFGYIVTDPHSPALSTDYELATASSEGTAYQPCDLNQAPQECSSYVPQAAEPVYHQPMSSSVCGTSSFQLQSNGYSDVPKYEALFIQEHVPQWAPSTASSYSQKSNIADNIKFSTSPTQSSSGLTLDWSACDQSSVPSMTGCDSFYQVPGRKQNASYEAPVNSSSWVDLSKKDINECVDVFENAPGALASVKRRKKLEAPVRKAAREVRKAGACHQCRFRKRTCSTGTPCASCLKNGNGLHDLKCQRESPFVGRLMHQYFAHSSTRRIVSFDIKLPLADLAKETIIIDGVRKISHPLLLKARKGLLATFSIEMQKSIRQTEDPKLASSKEDDSTVIILEDDGTLGTQVEQWAVEYTSQFVHAAGPAFHSTTMAHILGEAYVKRGLPESDLVAAMLRVASTCFVLRAGVKSTFAGSEKTPPRFRTIQAKIDTTLYQRLKLAERDLMTKLQRLIFRSAGCLTRDQVYPVGLVLWQLLRFLCISSSHLSNIARRFHSNTPHLAEGAQVPADYQTHGLKLVLSTHLALFRSSNPLLLDVSDRFNQDLLGGDKVLLKLGGVMRDVVRKMKDKGFPELKGSIAYRKEYFNLFRKVYDMK